MKKYTYSEIWHDPSVIMMLIFAGLVGILAIIFFVGYCICDRSDRRWTKRHQEKWNKMIAPLSRKERVQLAQEMNAMSQKPSRCGNVKNEVVELISENSSKCKCDEKNSDKDERKARINARRAAMKKQMNKIPDEVVPAVCGAVIDTSVMLTKTGYRVLRCVPPALNHIYSGAVTVHRHLNGDFSQQASAPPAHSVPARPESADKKGSKEKKNKSPEKSISENSQKNGGGWDNYVPNKEKNTTLPDKIEIQKCVYYDEKNKTHELEDLICKECFMADLRCSQTFKRPALPHRLPSPKYSNRKDCPLCSGPKKDEHKEYVCGGCLNLYDDINNMNYAT
ncbi:unnamed protein product [Oikopleura dioica]|uniref:Uncharacterized protein n=1 Tax=Oikopleura dioica TaxID=34765 RepID=E4Y9R8_OIKDI|nr:unnamed protein product [Oikopleura dioica]